MFYCSCFICGKKNNLTRVPSTAIVQCLIRRRFIIVENTRCCASHIQDGVIKSIDLDNIKSIQDTADLSGGQLKSILSQLCDKMSCLEEIKS